MALVRPLLQALTLTIFCLLSASGTAASQESPAQRLARFDTWRAGSEDASSLWDCLWCPPMAVVPAGTFTLGSPTGESDRRSDEGPQRRIVFARPLAVSRFEATVAEYEAFVGATGHPVGIGCLTDRETQGTWTMDRVSTLRDPGFPQANDHPVVCINWEDAQAYVRWLNTQVPGAGYRLLTEAEWEYVARAGSSEAFPWGADAHAGCAYMNGVDRTALAKYPTWVALRCSDGVLNTASVGVYRPNAFGIHDMIGNISEWVQDCSAPNYENLPPTGPQERIGCDRRIVRGGSWGSTIPNLRVADRFRQPPGHRDDSIGIRIARPL